MADLARPVYSVTSGDVEHERTARRGVTAESMLREEVEAMTGVGPDEEDRVLWRCDGGVPRAVAVIRPGDDGVPVVVRLDGKDGGR